LCFGMGLGFFATPGLNTAVVHTPKEKLGIASGIYKMVATIGAAFGITIFTTVYLVIDEHVSRTTGSFIAFLLFALFMFLSFLCSIVSTFFFVFDEHVFSSTGCFIVFLVCSLLMFLSFISTRFIIPEVKEKELF